MRKKEIWLTFIAVVLVVLAAFAARLREDEACRARCNALGAVEKGAAP